MKEKVFRKGDHMGRKEERARRKLERNPVVECNRVRKKYCPELFQDFVASPQP